MRLEAPPAFVFHSANAYEEGGRLIADCVCYPRMPDFEQVWQDCAPPNAVKQMLQIVINGYHDTAELQQKTSGLALMSRGVAMQACGAERSFCRHVEPHRQPLSELWRYDIDLAGRRMAGRRRLCDHVLEFPAVSPLCQGKHARRCPYLVYIWLFASTPGKYLVVLSAVALCSLQLPLLILHAHFRFHCNAVLRWR